MSLRQDYDRINTSVEWYFNLKDFKLRRVEEIIRVLIISYHVPATVALIQVHAMMVAGDI